MDFNKLYFKKQGDNYKVFIKKDDSLKPVGLKTPPLKIPFGLELWKNKEILNLEIPLKEGNNDVYNFHINLMDIEKFFNRITYDDKILEQYNIFKDLHEDLQLKQFVSSIKQRANFEPILRTHLKKRGNVTQTKFIKDGDIYPVSALEGQTAEFIIVLDSVWIKAGKCGLLWLVNKCEIISS